MEEILEIWEEYQKNLGSFEEKFGKSGANFEQIEMDSRKIWKGIPKILDNLIQNSILLKILKFTHM